MIRIIATALFTLLFYASAITSGDHSRPPVEPNTTESSPQPSHAKPTIGPNDALAILMKGNKRFIRSASLFSNQDQKRRTETAQNGQKPMVTILSCSDSRVPLEIIFDQGIGDIFAIRIAGNIADKTELGSIEYGVGHLETPLLIVLGHTKCGAVTAAVQNADVHGSIPVLIDRIKPAVEKARKERPDQSDEELLMRSIKSNVFQSIENIFSGSEEVRSLVREGKLKVIGALYDIETGEVSDLGVHYKQESLVRRAKK